jgi:hypothetical protein
MVSQLPLHIPIFHNDHASWLNDVIAASQSISNPFDLEKGLIGYVLSPERYQVVKKATATNIVEAFQLPSQQPIPHAVPSSADHDRQNKLVLMHNESVKIVYAGLARLLIAIQASLPDVDTKRLKHPVYGWQDHDCLTILADMKRVHGNVTVHEVAQHKKALAAPFDVTMVGGMESHVSNHRAECAWLEFYATQVAEEDKTSSFLESIAHVAALAHGIQSYSSLIGKHILANRRVEPFMCDGAQDAGLYQYIISAWLAIPKTLTAAGMGYGLAAAPVAPAGFTLVAATPTAPVLPPGYITPSGYTLMPAQPPAVPVAPPGYTLVASPPPAAAFPIAPAGYSYALVAQPPSRRTPAAKRAQPAAALPAAPRVARIWYCHTHGGKSNHGHGSGVACLHPGPGHDPLATLTDKRGGSILNC